MFKQFNPGELLASRAAKVASGPYEPAAFTAEMARKDVRLMIGRRRAMTSRWRSCQAWRSSTTRRSREARAGATRAAAFRYPIER